MLISMFFSRARKLAYKPNPRTRRNHLPTFSLIRPKTEFYKKSPYYRGASEWNKLPPGLQTISDKTSFKLQLKKHMGTYFKKPRAKKKKKKKPGEII